MQKPAQSQQLPLLPDAVASVNYVSMLHDFDREWLK